MNKDIIIQNIQRNMSLKGVPARDKAKMAYSLAKDAIGRLNTVPWNKITDTFDLTSSKGEYVVGSDILSNHTDIKGIIELWRTDQQSSQVKILSVQEFNAYRRGYTTPGAPTFATLRDNKDRELELEIYPIPNDNYTLWAYLRTPLEVGDIPDDYQDIILWKAIMIANLDNSSYYLKAKEMYLEIIDSLRRESYTRWEGTRINPDFPIGGSYSSSGRPDSGNIWGMG